MTHLDCNITGNCSSQCFALVLGHIVGHQITPLQICFLMLKADVTDLILMLMMIFALGAEATFSSNNQISSPGSGMAGLKTLPSKIQLSTECPAEAGVQVSFKH